jgi:hypothetical protein
MADKKPVGGAGGNPPDAAPKIVENLFGPELYAESAVFFSTKNGNVSITLTSGRFDAGDNGVLKHVTVGRLVMPLIGAQELVLGLYDFLAQRDLAPTIKPPDVKPS